ncbi:MAG: hypothetical protein IJX64_05110 [Clostridia bacterium]|nr:hypothetical protein [Clostridia bacterium]
MRRISAFLLVGICLALCFSACTEQNIPGDITTAKTTAAPMPVTDLPPETTAVVTTGAVTTAAQTTAESTVIATEATTVATVTTEATTVATTATTTETTAATTTVATTTEAVITTAPEAVPAEPLTRELLAIGELNRGGTEGDHAKDDILRASLEMNFREISEAAGYPRLEGIEYPRLKKIADDFYILFYYKSVHLYYTISTDCMTWTEPVVFRNARDFPIPGIDGIYYGRGPDAVVLPDGTILVAYAVHPSVGYKTDMDNHSIRVRRGFVMPNKQIAWGIEQTVYVGMNWEPSFQLLDDGTIRLYFTQTAPYTSKYGYDDEIRSSGTGMLTSTDNGYTWTPSITAGDTQYYRATTVYQQFIGNKTVTFGGEKITVPYFNGQMPQAVSLVDGRTLLAAEIRHLDDNYMISLATSKADGSWKALDFEEEGPDTAVKDLIPHGAAPYLARFPSGEVLLTYRHDKGKTLYGMLISPDATVYGKEFSAVNNAKGSMGSCTVLDAHCVATVNPFLHKEDDHTIQIVRSYLNHRINAPKTTVTVDGYTNDWKDNTDALFVGSDSQAQVTLRVAHDDKNVYFLFSRLDDCMVNRDYVTVNIGVSDNEYYTLTVASNGILSCHYYLSGSLMRTVEGASAEVAVLGTLGDNTDTDTGALYEVSIPKSVLGLENAEQFVVSLALSNTDTGNTIYDTMTNIKTTSTETWPVVRLDP